MISKEERHKDFVVLKGIEYDTIDAGHILVIMPEGVKIRILELRGLPVRILIDVVQQKRRYPGTGTSLRRTISEYRQHQKKREAKTQFCRKFDFIETFNACESQESNDAARSWRNIS